MAENPQPEKRPISIDDLYQITQIEDPRISPDGQWIAYVRVSIDRLENGYKRNIWLISRAGGDPIQLTRSGKDSTPRWSPDGHTLAFVSGRDKKPQIYLLRVTAPGGEPRALTSLPNGANSPSWSPDGTQIAFLASLNADERAQEDSGESEPAPKDKLEAKHRSERKEQDEAKRFDPRMAWRIPYRVGTAFLDERYAQVYVIPVSEKLSKDDAKPRRLTNTDANHESPQWTPDGQFVLTARTLDPLRDVPWRWNTLYRIRVADKQEEQLTDDSHSDGSPRSSPDGKWIAYLRTPTDRLTERITRLSILSSTDGSIRDLNLELDRNVTGFHWSADSQAIFFTADSWGSVELYRVNLSSGAIDKIVEGTLEIIGFDVDENGKLVYVASTPTNPAELFSDAGVLTDLNTQFLAEVRVQEPIEVRFAAENAPEIQGWYILPSGYESGKQYPLAVNIHGGPHVMWGASTQSIWHEMQAQAAQGYVVFYCNPRGAGGYGEGFQMALHQAWGDVAMADVMAGVDKMISLGMVDPQRLAVTGGSYGGYLTAWIVGHSDRFKAAVGIRGVYNLLGFYGTSDVPLLITNEFDAEPWEDPTMLWQHSPLAYAHQIKTPLLVIHSENDFRVPISEGEQLFAYVRRSGGTVRMIRFPREGHELSRSGEPEHRASSLTHLIEWFDQYCK